MVRSSALITAFSLAVITNLYAQSPQSLQSQNQASRVSEPEDKPAFKKTRLNTFEFDHLKLAPVFNAPAVLRVKDGEYFQVLFQSTDPRKFRYAVSVTDDAALRETSFAAGRAIMTERANLTTASVTMRHDEHFKRYRVSATFLDGVGANASGQPAERRNEGRAPASETPTQPKVDLVSLHEISFDLWVETTPGWNLSFSGGTAFSGLTNERFFISTDNKETATADDDVKLVKLDPDDGDAFRPDIVALANLSHPKAKHVGLAFGLGLNNDADPRYFIGPSIVLGNKFILHGGLAGGKVAALPAGQQLDKAPIAGDNTLSSGATKFKKGFYIGIAFTFVERDDEFKGAFAGTTSSRPPASPDGGGPDAADGDIAGDAFVGNYTTADDKPVEIGKAANDGLVITVDRGRPFSFTQDQRKGLVWSTEVKTPDGVVEPVVLTFTADDGAITGLEYRQGAVTLKAMRSAQ